MLPRQNRRSAFTLVELLTALVIIAVLSTAVATLLAGAARTSLFVNNSTDATSQVENAQRRIVYNLRHASAISAPANTTAASTLTLTTQPDSANGNAPYTVTYTLTGTNLTESDTRYNSAGTPNIIASNVTAFTVTRNSLSSPTTVTLNLTVSASPPVTRTITVYCRNL